MNGQVDILSRINLSKIKSQEQTLEEKYGNNFQTNLLKAFITDHKFYLEIFESLEKRMMSEHHSYIYEKFNNHFKLYNNLPNKEILEQYINNESISHENKILIHEIKNKIFDISENFHIDYYKDTTKKFIRNYKVKQSLLKSIEYLQNEDYDSIISEISESLKSSSFNKRLGIDLFNSLELMKHMLKRETIPTPFSALNHPLILDGGLGKKELGLIMGGTSAGKSWMLQYLAIHAILNNHPVVYYTLEMQDVSVQRRLCSILLRKGLKEVTDKDILQIREIVRDHGITSSFFIVEYPTKSASVFTLKRNLLDLYNHYGFTPSLILVDYADLLLATQKYDQKRHELSGIYEELRGLAGETNSPLWTASQVNREGYNKSKLTVQNIAEDYGKTTICDFILSIGRTIDDRVGNRGTAFIAKNRNGKDAIEFPLNMDLDNAIIEMEEEAREPMPNEYKQNNEIDNEYISNLLNSYDEFM